MVTIVTTLAQSRGFHQSFASRRHLDVATFFCCFDQALDSATLPNANRSFCIAGSHDPQVLHFDPTNLGKKRKETENNIKEKNTKIKAKNATPSSDAVAT